MFLGKGSDMLKDRTSSVQSQTGKDIPLGYSPKYATILLLAVFILLANALYADRDPAYIPDSNFRQAINFNLGQPANYQPTVADLMSLTGEFWGSDWAIHSIIGAEHMINVANMDLSDNLVSDISPLAGLTNLTFLSLQVNQIVDISPLAALINLQNLVISDNQIMNISPLGGLTNLEMLEMSNNLISSIAPLMTLTHLERLQFMNNQISDISPLSGLLELQMLYMDYNQISDLNPLLALTDLWCLNFVGNLISDISVVAELPALQYIRGGVNQISDISPISGLVELWMVDFWDNQIIDISPLSSLTNVTYLILSYNQISDLQPLSGLTDLIRLDLHANQISDIGLLAAMDDLQELDLGANQIRDISSLVGLSLLMRLNLESNRIDDLRSVSQLTNLQELFLRYNEISDIIPVAGLTGLSYLWLMHNPLSRESMLLSQAWELPYDTNQFNPLAPCYPDPARNATYVPLNTTLNWEANYEDVTASQEVYLGTDPDELVYVGAGSLTGANQYSWTTQLLPDLDYFWRVRSVSVADTVWSGVWKFSTGAGSENYPELALEQSGLKTRNYPNPFNSSTTISYELPENGTVTLEVYNVKGQLVSTLVRQTQTKGIHSIVWNGKDDKGSACAGGIYFYRIVWNSHSLTNKILLMTDES